MAFLLPRGQLILMLSLCALKPSSYRSMFVKDCLCLSGIILGRACAGESVGTMILSSFVCSRDVSKDLIHLFKIVIESPEGLVVG